MFHTSFIEISRSALENNLRFIRNLIGREVRFSSVVKGNAYGHGIELFVPLAEECEVDHFSVFSTNEALRVSKVSNGQSTIMIMGMIDNQEIEWAISNDVEFFVFELDRLQKALDVSKKVGKPARIHLEVETGMNRTGLEQQELPKAIQLLKENPYHLCFKGLCTHFAGAESVANYYRIKHQRTAYKKIKKQLQNEGLQAEIHHVACSAAALRYPNTLMDLARIGILQYGFFPSRETFIEHISDLKEPKDPLARMITWKSRVMDVKNVKTGDFIGYGTTYLANRNMKIATIPVGYAHGFTRSLSNQGRVLIHGKRVQVAGMVNMNMMAVDVTNLETPKKGDEVVLIGYQGNLEISVSAFGESSSQVNYELLTRLPGEIPRRVIS